MPHPQHSLAYNIYRSTDPDLSKEQWILLNDKPIPHTDGRMQYRDKTAIPGAVYYVYIKTINALGFESEPSSVIKIDSSDEPIILDDTPPA